MKYELLKGLVDTLDRINTLSDGIKSPSPATYEWYRNYLQRVHQELDLAKKFYRIGDNDEIIVSPEYQEEPVQQAPIPLIIHCPICGTKHVDVDEYAEKAHHTHACQGRLENGRPCGNVWRPALVPTVGVDALPGFLNEPWMEKVP